MRISASPLVIRDTASNNHVKGAVVVRLDPATSGFFASDVCFVVDCSSRMHSDRVVVQSNSQQGISLSKLEFVRRVLKPLCADLRPGNTLSLVTFNESASVLINRATINHVVAYDSAIDSLKPKTGCHVAIGLREAACLLDACTENRSRRIILLTGGRLEDFGAASMVMEELTTKQIDLDIVSIGDDGPLLELRQLAKSRGGHAHVSSDLDQTMRILHALVIDSQIESVRDVQLQLQPPVGWNVTQCIFAGMPKCTLPISMSDSSGEVTARLKSASSIQCSEVVFFLRSYETQNEAPNSSFSIKLEFKKHDGEHESLVQRFETPLLDCSAADTDLTSQGLQSFLEQISLFVNISQWEDAIAIQDLSKADQELVGLECSLGRLDMPEGKRLVNNMLKGGTTKAPSGNVAQKAMLLYFENMPTESFDLLSSSAEMYAKESDPKTDSVFVEEPPAGQEDNSGVKVALQLLSHCRETLLRRNELLIEVNRLENENREFETSRTANAKARFIELVERWTDAIAEVDRDYVAKQVAAFQELNDVVANWTKLIRKIDISALKQRETEQILRNLLDTRDYYRWTELGWAASLNGVKQRRELLERVSNREGNDERS